MDDINKFSLKGLVPAVFTPLTKSGDINPELVPRYASFLREKGIKSVFVNGTTGEGNNLTVEERKCLAEAWMANHKHGLENVLIHVGGANLRESQDLATHAAKIGADAIGMMPPSFFKPTNITTLVLYCKEVAARAPKTPFYYYNIPIMSGVSFNMLEYTKLMEKDVPTYRGIKYSNWDMTEASLLHNYGNSKYSIVFGVDQQLLAALSFGLQAAIGSTYNFMAPIYHSLIAAYEQGDMEQARSEQLKTQKALDVIFKYASLPRIDYDYPRRSGTSILKEVMNLCIDIDLGPVRLPLIPALPAEQNQKLKAELQELEFFEWI